MEQENRFRRNRRTAAARQSGGRMARLLLPLLSTLAAAGLLLALGLTRLEMVGHITQDGFAVPQNALVQMMKNGETGLVSLASVSMGDSIFARGMSRKNYLVGDEQKAIDAGYPLFTQSGQVLCFLSDSMKLVTWNWEVLSSYDGLYLSDGATFNRDRSRADLQRVLLVEVDGGYQVARKTTLKTGDKQRVIPMNSLCVFEENSILYFDYQNGNLQGSRIAAGKESVITIGEDSFDYLSFLRNLGLWAEKAAEPAPKKTEPPKAAQPLSNDDETATPEPPRSDGKAERLQVTNLPVEKNDNPTPPAKTPAPPQPPSTELQKPGDAIAAPNENVSPPGSPPLPEDINPGYIVPTVVIQPEIEAAVYTLNINAMIHDPSRAISGGVQIYVYEVTESREIQALRQVLNASGKVYLGQFKPDTQYRLKAKYSYTDKLSYPQTVEWELGSQRTLPFAELRNIAVSFYDEEHIPAGAAAVEVFPTELQLRSLVFGEVSNGVATEAGGVSEHIAADLSKPETYINVFNLKITDPDGGTRVVKMNPGVLRLLREGYTLSHWESGGMLLSGKGYTYTLELLDRYGNLFNLEGTTNGAGHTCKNSPRVNIRIPGKTNVAGSVQVDVTWNNPDAAPVFANDGEGAAMGSSLIAGLFLVRQGDEITPQNAVPLNAYPLGSASSALENAKFLPVTVNTDAAVTTVTTQWVVTNLEVLKGYSAGVLCGGFEVEDGREHVETVLDSTVNFATASLTNLGVISYTSMVENITSDSAGLSFRMNSADERLLPLLDAVTLSLTADGEERTQSILLKRDELKAVAIAPTLDAADGLMRESVEIPVHPDGAGTEIYARLTLSGEDIPEISEDTPAANVWDYLLATAKADARDKYRLTLELGSALRVAEGEAPVSLFTLSPSTLYRLRYKTQANQGGEEYDVSSRNTRDVVFTTRGLEAKVNLGSVFASADFVELYGLSINDPDGCISPDNADRDGCNVIIRITNKTGALVGSRYIDSSKTYDGLRISGLETDTDYLMTLYALRYSSDANMELNFALDYAEPQELSTPKVYAFTTGKSVIGDLSLEGVSQLYGNEDGSSTDALSILNPEDIYMSVWQYGATLYYSDDDAKTRYLEQVNGVEAGSDDEETEALRALASGETSALRLTANTSAYVSNGWTTRFVAVQPGEKFCIYNTEASGYLRINLYYKDAAGALKSYGMWASNDNYMRGGVFRIPDRAISGNVNADRICYMRISGYTQRECDGMILVRYNDGETASRENLAAGLRYVEGMQLNTSNGQGFSAGYAYTEGYIPVTSGSVYEMLGRDPNRNEEDALNNRGATYSAVLFYDEGFGFLGGYNLCNQTSLIKVPFGAAYCRFNVIMSQAGGTPTLDTSRVSMRLYKGAVADRYLIKLKAELSDPSDNQLLTGGKYSVALYSTLAGVSDSDDLETADYVPLGEPQVFSVTEADLEDGKLDVTKQLRFENLNPGMGFKATLKITPAGWENGVVVDTVYFTTNRVVHTISDLAGLKAIRIDPAGSYVVTADIEGLTGNIISSDRPFTGTIDFQGHSVTTSSFASMFYRISTTGVVKNLVYNYDALASESDSYQSGMGTVATINYGRIQNLIVHYNPDNRDYGIDVRYAGGIVRYNYGVIDGFMVEFMKDVRAYDYFGGVCQENYGTVSNGYICTSRVTDSTGERDARLIHIRQNSAGAVLTTQTPCLSYCVGNNTSKGTVENVFALGNLVIQSADASTDYSNADYASGNESYESSTTNTSSAAILVGSNTGAARNSFTVGDRLDFEPDRNRWSYMLDRGPAIASVTGRYEAENITAFSFSANAYSQRSSADSSIGTYNRRGEFESLFDYRWYETNLGSDGTKFSIRQNVEQGYYPTLVLPECFPPDAQPQLRLPENMLSRVEIVENVTRQQGISSALVTITLSFPYAGNAEVTGFTVTDRQNRNIDCQVLSQRSVENSYRVDVLLTLPEGALADSSYTITGVRWTGGSRSFAGRSSEREIKADFWREISDTAQWQAAMVIPTAYIYGNYRLTADIDFSESAGYSDWFCSQRFYGTLDGGIYSTKTVTVTDSAGGVITNREGQPLTMEVRDALTGMHTISGVGNTDKYGNYVRNRDGDSRGSLISALYGTVKNLIFRDFVTTDKGETKRSANSYRSGVISYSREGARVQNCHVRDSVFYARCCASALVGDAAGTAMSQCSVRNTKICCFKTDTGTDSVSTGALFGSMSSGIVEACFAADVTVEALNVFTTMGVGALGGTASGVTVQDCYATGTVNAAGSYVGGILGRMSGAGTLTGCWSTASVQTVSDFAGGIVGYHADGILSGNYTASTIVTRSLASSSVHRICSNPAYNEEKRFANYAFKGQFMTYTDTSLGVGSMYQFGTWSKTDGATALLDTDELKNAGVWKNIISVGASYDLEGAAASGGVSGATEATAVRDGVMPKLTATDTGLLLYDQPDVLIGKTSDTILSRIYVGLPDTNNEEFYVELVLYSDAFDPAGRSFADMADWKHASAGGAAVVGADKPNDSQTGIFGFTDGGSYTDTSGTGRKFSFKLKYGAAAGEDGHYLDSYIFSLPVNVPDGGTEMVQVRISLSEPVYKRLYSIEEWDVFFSDPRYAQSYENVLIAWNNTSEAGCIDFGKETVYSAANDGRHVINVKANRLSGEGRGGVLPTIKNAALSFTSSNQNLISQIVTMVSDLNFESISLVTGKNSGGAYYGGDNKGVIAQLQGDAENLTFTDIKVDGGASSYVGCIGSLWGRADRIELKNITAVSYGNYVGGLVGFANTTSTISNVSLGAAEGNRNRVMSKNNGIVGGIAGAMYGIGSDLSVTDTDVQGRAFVGGAVGYAYSDAGRPTERKLINVTVGRETDASNIPGAKAVPGVTVTLALDEGTTTSENRYGGGAVGHANNKSLKNIRVYDTFVSLPRRIETVDTADNGTYAYYLGGVVGCGGSGLVESLAKNVTVASYGGWCGGISGDSVGQYNRAEECAVYGISLEAQCVGGVMGTGGGSRSIAKHCVVAGENCVGGVIGRQTTWSRENGAVDCLVLGDAEVGGISGRTTYYYTYDNYVTATTGEDGTAATTTTLDANILRGGEAARLLGEFGGTYTGAHIVGTQQVGGIVGQLAGGITIHDCYAAPGVKIKGETDVGGIVGRFYGWYADSGWPTTNTQLYNAACGAEVEGRDNVGGIIGCYTRSLTGNPSASLTSIDHPNGSFYGYLFTGSVSGTGKAGFLVGAYTQDPANDGVDGYLNYCRVYENATLNGAAASTRYGEAAYDKVQALTKESERTGYAGVLTVTAENLMDSNVYFQPRGNAYGGMGWSRTVWSAEAMDSLFVKSADPASTAAYMSGINQEQQVLWLDARNNTGSGCMDKTAGVWKDLSGSGNDARLYWAYKTDDEPLTMEEKNNYMVWKNGGLEFYSTSSAYYARLEETLSPYLQENYTVELIYTFQSPAYNGNGSVLSWWDGGYSGGFMCSSYSNGTVYKSTALYTDMTDAGRKSSWLSGADVSSQNTRTAAFVVGAKNGSNSPVAYFINGEQKCANAALPAAFRDTQDLEWRIGSGMYSSNGMRVCGVRVYSRALSADEILKNAEYDKWYYFGGAKPADADSTAANYTLNADGTASQSGLMLMRSGDGSYNGTPVCRSFTSGMPLGGRGYYYLTDGEGHYSNVVTVTKPGYGPFLRTVNLDNEYYGTAKYLNVPGQEGISGSGELFSGEDGLINGGYRMPESRLLAQTLAPMMLGRMSLARAAEKLPEAIAYSSGVDRINMEIREDAPEGLQYEILSGGKTRLTGVWPEDSRTLTMTWDFGAEFTLRLSRGGQQTEYTWNGKTLARSVMTYGTGYWYRYYGECLNQNGDSAAPDAAIIHMMDGSLLDDAGNIRSAETGLVTGRAVPFTLAPAKPLWSGKAGDNSVSSFATYLICDGGVRDLQLVVRGDCAFTMPARDVVPGSFVIDSYNDNIYTTVLTTGGSIVDLGSALVYPKDFSTQQISELSCSVGYSGHMVLVRYESGQLAAFNYLTGETDEVSSEAKEISLLQFILTSIAGDGDKTTWKKSASRALTAAKYQREVESDPALQMALNDLRDNPETGNMTDGEGEGSDEEGLPGGQDGAAGAGVDERHEQETVTDETQSVVAGIGEDNPGDENSPETDENNAAEREDETAPASKDKVNSADEGSGAAEETAKPGAKPEKAPASGSNATDAKGAAEPKPVGASGGKSELRTRYVTVYSAESGDSSVYSLDELLSKPEEKLVSEDAYAQQLNERGFQTALVRQKAVPAASAGGLSLLAVTTAVTACLLVALGLIKRRKMDGKGKRRRISK